jgi:response regulator of citrate/malate metabolism
MEGNMEIVLIVIVIGLYILEFIEKRKLQRKIDEFNKKEPKLTKEEKEKQEKIQKSFNNLMEYDYDTALKGKKE